MSDALGPLLTRWTIRLALVCYVAYLGGALWPRTNPAGPWLKIGRWIWTIGCGLFLCHVACAFGFYHGWSHIAAYEDTAKQTEQMLGVPFGGGIYFSYLFAAIWTLDVAWRWLGEGSRPRWLAIALHAYMFFIAANGAMVFEGGVTRWGGLLACVGLAAVSIKRFWSVEHVPAPSQSSAGRECPPMSDSAVS